MGYYNTEFTEEVDLKARRDYARLKHPPGDRIFPDDERRPGDDASIQPRSQTFL